MTKLFVAMERLNNINVVVNPEHFQILIPSDGMSEVYISGQKLAFSNDAIQAMIRESGIEVLAIEEPQIAGVSDEDIKDETKPVTLDEVVDENDIERAEDKVVEGIEDLVVEETAE